MKITSSSIQLGAQSSALERHERHESLIMWTGKGQRTLKNDIGHGQLRGQVEGQASVHRQAVEVNISEKAAASQQVAKAGQVNSIKPDSVDQLKLDILKALIERLTGKKIEIKTPDEIACPDQAQDVPEAAPERQSDGFGMIYDYYESYYERQEMTFSASGSISTADGRQIEFSVDLSLSREFYAEQHVQVRAGEALKDPLAVNFSGRAADLTSTKFAFDIDADGSAEQVSFLRPGSGLLALDRNSDGKINNGRELFGAMTGNGFDELAAFDEDGNNFIDENDSIFHRLRIWEKGRNGKDRLLALGQVGIGAIYLGNVTTPFDLKNHANDLMGKIRSTGLFIREDGSAGTLQQLDLVA